MTLSPATNIAFNNFLIELRSIFSWKDLALESLTKPDLHDEKGDTVMPPIKGMEWFSEKLYPKSRIDSIEQWYKNSNDKKSRLWKYTTIVIGWSLVSLLKTLHAFALSMAVVGRGLYRLMRAGGFIAEAGGRTIFDCLNNLSNFSNKATTNLKNTEKHDSEHGSEHNSEHHSKHDSEHDSKHHYKCKDSCIKNNFNTSICFSKESIEKQMLSTRPRLPMPIRLWNFSTRGKNLKETHSLLKNTLSSFIYTDKEHTPAELSSQKNISKKNHDTPLKLKFIHLKRMISFQMNTNAALRNTNAFLRKKSKVPILHLKNIKRQIVK